MFMQEPLLALVDNSKNYTLSVAQMMPEGSYEFRPEGALWNFSELLQHIAYGIGWWEENYILEIKTPWAPPVFNGQKNEIITRLNDSYDSLKKTINKMTISENGIKGIYATLDHITHHRGQAVLYLRCNGIAAPEYIY